MNASGKQQEEALDLARTVSDSCVGVRVGYLHRLVSRRFETALRPLGLTLVQMEILTGLTLIGEPVKPALIAEKLGVERSTMSRNLTLLESRGLVLTTNSSASDRSLAVAISTAGTRKLIDARAAWAEAQEAVISRAGADVPATLDGWIDELGQAPIDGGRGRRSGKTQGDGR